MKKKLLATLMSAITIISAVTVYADDNKNYDKDDTIIIEASNESVISGADGVDKDSRARSMDYDNVAVRTAAGFDFDRDTWWSSSDSDRVRGYAKTTLTCLDAYDTVDTWDLQVSGNLYKNGHYCYGIPSTKDEDSTYIKVYSAYDNYASDGDDYEVYTYHRVYDYYGTKIWDVSEENSMTF